MVNQQTVIYALLAVAAFAAYQKGYFKDILGPGGSTPPPSGGGGTVTPGGVMDENGINWFFADGEITTIAQSRTDANDHRWSGNVTGLSQFGYEATMIVDFTGASVGSGGHFAMKGWGPNHSGSHELCCWYDFGIRSNGDVQTQIERPHPDNQDVSCPGCTMDNIGTGMDGSILGLKWLVAPLIAGGSAENGGIKLMMWVDTSALTGGVPTNNWQLVLDGVDDGSILGNGYQAPDEMDMEIRISDTDGEQDFGGGLHVRKLTKLVTESGGAAAARVQTRSRYVEESVPTNQDFLYNRIAVGRF